MMATEEFEDTKGVIRIPKSKKNRQHNGQERKDRQRNGQKNRDKQRSTKHTHKANARATRTSLNT